MPVADTTPARKLVIRRGQITYIVDETKYDTVVITEDDGTNGTYKDLGFKVVSAIENGTEIPYVKREHVSAVPGREDVAAEQVDLLAASGQPVPASLARAAGVVVDAPTPAPRAASKAEPSKTGKEAAE